MNRILKKFREIFVAPIDLSSSAIEEAFIRARQYGASEPFHEMSILVGRDLELMMWQVISNLPTIAGFVDPDLDLNEWYLRTLEGNFGSKGTRETIMENIRYMEFSYVGKPRKLYPGDIVAVDGRDFTHLLNKYDNLRELWDAFQICHKMCLSQEANREE